MTPTDTERLDWLEKHLLRLHHSRATFSVDMGGKDVGGMFQMEPTFPTGYFKVHHRTIREAIDEAITRTTS